MDWQLQIKLNEELFLRDPETSELGKRIIRHGIELLHELGFEDFTFKKLAQRMSTNESSVYRYFENKHRLLVYLVDWYWRWIEYQLFIRTQNITDPVIKIDIVIRLLLLQVKDEFTTYEHIDKVLLHQVVLKEASKVYLTHHVTDDNQKKLFKPYKDLCARIAQIILEFNPDYTYPRSLSSTLIEMAHYQHFFMLHLPSLTDFEEKDEQHVFTYLRHLVYSCIRNNSDLPPATR